MKPYLLLLLFLTISTLSFAQQGTVTGRVVDSESKEPLPFTTVAAFEGDRLVTGTTTGDDGRFSLELPYGTYRLVIQFLSYAEKRFNEVTLSAEQPQRQLGDVTLAESEETLQAVEVEGQAMEMQLSLDKKVFNVSDNLATKGGTATDILDNIPSVAVDVEGNVSLRGSDNVRILVDGKPSGLTGANALRQLPADLIERVEVITNPSARYEAQGMAGIINIVLKKERRNGLNGSIDVNTGWPHNHGLGVNLNFRRKAANFFINLGTRYRTNLGGGFNDQIFFNPNDFRLDDNKSIRYSIRNQSTDRERSEWSNNIRLGSDFFLNDKNTLTASFLYNRGLGNNESVVYYNFLEAAGESALRSTRQELEDEIDQNLEWSLDYRRTFEEKNRVLTGSVQYRLNTETEDATYNERFFFPNGETAKTTDFQRSFNEENQNNTLLQLDYVDPLGEKGQWEAGMRTSFRRINTDYRVESLQDGNYLTLPGFSNEFEYIEDIHAAYGQVGIKQEPFSYMLGLRAEYSMIDTRLREPNYISNRRDYLNLFPSAFATYSFSELASIQLSYSRRVRRPGFRELNPFRSFSDARNIRLGNPNLDPEFTHSLELGYLRNFTKGSLTSSLFYRHTDGVIQWYRSSINDSDTTFSQPVNLGTRRDLGVEFVLSYDPAKWWTLNQSFNVFRSVTEADLVAQELSNERNLSVKTFGWQARLNSRMKFGNGLNFQQTFFYMAPQDIPQGRRLAMYMLNLGLSKDILKDKGTLTLSVDDLLNSRKWRSETETANFYSNAEFQWRRRTVTLSLNYRINQDRSNRRDNRRQQRQEGGGDEGMDF